MPENFPTDDEPTLARRIGLPLLIFYGLGTILGAGIYVLIGQVAARAGLLAPLSFLIAAVVAAVTALSYCQLVVLYPHSSGAASYIQNGLGRPGLGQMVGFLVILTGVVSAATLANGFTGYLAEILPLPSYLAMSILILIMGGLAIWGIAESLWVAAVITLVETGGLVMVVALSADNFSNLPNQFSDLFVPMQVSQWTGVLSGAFLAFYAFIGFEDMVNIVEEVKRPERDMPRGILAAVLVATVLYILVALAAVLGLSIERLAESSAPVSDLVAVNHPEIATWIVLVSIVAIVNGVLIQMIMASRVLYGMAAQGKAPAYFSTVARRTRTPIKATFVIIFLIWCFALWLPLVTLASLTSFITLIVFMLVNLSLWRVQNHASFVRPIKRLRALPRIGVALCVTLLGFQVASLLSRVQ